MRVGRERLLLLGWLVVWVLVGPAQEGVYVKELLDIGQKLGARLLRPRRVFGGRGAAAGATLLEP